MSRPTQFKLSLFGGFQLRDNLGKSVDLGPRKAKALLAWLAVNPDTEHPREKIAALLWPDREEGQARHSLRQVLSCIRKVMPENLNPLSTSKEWVRLDSTRIHADVHKFESAILSGSRKAPEKVAILYKGEFLAGCNPRADLFDDWVMDYRHHFREKATAIMCRKLSQFIDEGAYKRAVPLAIQLINIDPLRESAYRALMLAHLALGNYALALRWYRRCERTLLKELSVLPCFETRAVHAKVLGTWDAAQSGEAARKSVAHNRKPLSKARAKGYQRAMFQSSAAMESIIDHIGGQSILIRGGSDQMRAGIFKGVVKLAEPQGFKICRGEISTSQACSPTEGVPSTTDRISGCLGGGLPAIKASIATTESALSCANLSDEADLSACLAAIEQAATHSPLLLILENVHAAGKRLRVLIAGLVSATAHSSILLIMTSHPGGQSLELPQSSAGANAVFTTIDLAGGA